MAEQQNNESRFRWTSVMPPLVASLLTLGLGVLWNGGSLMVRIETLEKWRDRANLDMRVAALEQLTSGWADRNREVNEKLDRIISEQTRTNLRICLILQKIPATTMMAGECGK